MTFRTTDGCGIEIDLVQRQAEARIFVIEIVESTGGGVIIFAAVIVMAACAMIDIFYQAVCAAPLDDLLGNILMALQAQHILVGLKRGVAKVALSFKISM